MAHPLDTPPAPEPSTRRSPGRPPKTGAKSKAVTFTLYPDELAALDALLAAVNAGLPAHVTRVDLARLAFSQVLTMTPAAVRKALVAARQARP